ncbi:MAG TPA: hypothetical protein VFQ79_14170 [Bryobacteraceae bacterium]|nr:hypothetical protein [Bryobacteraceae bacterium]
MSDYMFMLESHLTAGEARVLADVQAAAAEANVNLFLAGGAMRDMLGGFVIRDLDFTIEGNAVKLARKLAQKTGAKILAVDDHRKCVELLFPGNVTAEIGMARQERFPKPGGRAQVSPATIYEDLKGRDFTVNSIALSLNKSSRGLLLDPNNGLADLEHKELRAVTNYTLYDEPVRVLRLIRFKVRLGFTIAEKTEAQYRAVREAGLESKIGPRSLLHELTQIAAEANAVEVVRALDQEGLLRLFSPALTGQKVNLAGLARLQKARQFVPFGVDFQIENTGLFLNILTEKLTPKEKSAMAGALKMEKPEIDAWQKLDARVKKLETALKSPRLQKPSLVYKALENVPGEEILFLYLRTGVRVVQDRIRNYLQRYLPTAQEVTEADVAAPAGVETGSPKYAKFHQAAITARLDARPKKVSPPPEPETQATAGARK